MAIRFLRTTGFIAATALTMGALAQDSGDIARDVDPDSVPETLTSIDTRDPGNYVADSQLRALYTLAESPVAGGELEFSPAATESSGNATGGTATGGTATGGTATGGAAVGRAASATDETGELSPLPCTGECLQAWPPLTIEAGTEPTVTAGMNPELVGTKELEDGTVQVTYGGYPLHYFSGDEMQGGRLNGIGVEAFGGTWYAVSATTGVPLETDSSAAEGGGTGEDGGE